MTTRTNYILVDFENVQPNDLSLLKNGSFKVKVFLGPTSKISASLAMSMQALGDQAEYIQLDKAGNNALDFHIAYYIGRLSMQDPTAFFHVISKDKGFDPLLKHLFGKNILAKRSVCIADIPCLNNSPALAVKTPATQNDQIQAIIANLIRRKTSKPGTSKTLLNDIHTLFKKELSEQKLKELLATLCRQGFVKIEGTKVSYMLPTQH